MFISRFTRLCAFAVFLPAFTGCTPHACFKAPEAVPEEVRACVDSALGPYLRNRRSIGTLVGVFHGGSRYVLGYGDVRKICGSCPDSATLFEIGSVTKTFTGTLLGSMAKDGIVGLEDPLRLYVPDGVNVPSYEGREITLVDLATHSSGLPELPKERKSSPGYCILNPWANFTEEDLYAFLSSVALTRRPGESYEYSTLGIALLANALASRAGMQYEELLRQRILDPIGLQDTSISLTNEQRDRSVRGYTTLMEIGGTPLIQLPMPRVEFGAMAGGGALKSTVDDMLTYMETVMESGESSLHDAVQLATSSHFTMGPSDSVGLGWFIHKLADEKGPLVWHNGQTFSCSSFLGFFPEERVGIVILNNTDALVDDAGIEILTKLTGRTIL